MRTSLTRLRLYLLLIVAVIVLCGSAFATTNFSFNNASFVDPLTKEPVTYFLITNLNMGSPANPTVVISVSGYASQGAYQAGAQPAFQYNPVTLAITGSLATSYFNVVTTSNLLTGSTLGALIAAQLALSQTFLLNNASSFPNAPWLSGATIGT